MSVEFPDTVCNSPVNSIYSQKLPLELFYKLYKTKPIPITLETFLISNKLHIWGFELAQPFTKLEARSDSNLVIFYNKVMIGELSVKWA